MPPRLGNVNSAKRAKQARRKPKPPTVKKVAQAAEDYYKSQGRQVQNVATYQRKRGITAKDFAKPGQHKGLPSSRKGASRSTSSVVAASGGKRLVTAREARRQVNVMTPGTKAYRKAGRRALQRVSYDTALTKAVQRIVRRDQQQRTSRAQARYYQSQPAKRTYDTPIQQALRQEKEYGARPSRLTKADLTFEQRHTGDAKWPLAARKGLMSERDTRKVVARAADDPDFARRMASQGIVTGKQLEDFRVKREGERNARRDPTTKAVGEITAGKVAKALVVQPIEQAASGIAKGKELLEKAARGESNYQRVSGQRKATDKAVSETAKAVGKAVVATSPVLNPKARKQAKRAIESTPQGKAFSRASSEVAKRANLEEKAKDLGKGSKATAEAAIIGVADQITRSSHAIAAAAREDVRDVKAGRLPIFHGSLTAAKRGFELKDRSTFSDVLGEAGVRNPYVRAGVGFLLDVGLDPLTYFSGGLSTVSHTRATLAAAKAGKRAMDTRYAAEIANGVSKGRAAARAKEAGHEASATIMERARRSLLHEGEQHGVSVRFGGHRGPRAKLTRSGKAKVTGRGVTIVPARATAAATKGARKVADVSERVPVLGATVRGARKGKRGVRQLASGQTRKTGPGSLSSMVRPATMTREQFAETKIIERVGRARGEAHTHHLMSKAAALNKLTNGEPEWRLLRKARETGDYSILDNAPPVDKQPRVAGALGGKGEAARVKTLANNPNRLKILARDYGDVLDLTHKEMRELKIPVGYRGAKDPVAVPEVTANPAATRAAKAEATRARKKWETEHATQTFQTGRAQGRAEEQVKVSVAKQRQAVKAVRRQAEEAEAEAGVWAERARFTNPEAAVRQTRGARAQMHRNRAATLRRQADEMERQINDRTPGRATTKAEAETSKLSSLNAEVVDRTAAQAENFKRARDVNRRRARAAAKRGDSEAQAKFSKVADDAQASLDRVRKTGGRQVRERKTGGRELQRLRDDEVKAAKLHDAEVALHKEQRLTRAEAERINAERTREAQGYVPRYSREVTARVRGGKDVTEGEVERALEAGAEETPMRGAASSYRQTRQRTEPVHVYEASVKPGDAEYAAWVSPDIVAGLAAYGGQTGRDITEAVQTQRTMLSGRLPSQVDQLGPNDALYRQVDHKIERVTSSSEIRAVLDGQIEGDYRVLPKGQVEWLENLRKSAWSDTENFFGQVMRATERGTARWKGVTLGTPGYIGRNLMSDMFAAYGAQNPARLVQNLYRARKLLGGQRKFEQQIKWFGDEMEHAGKDRYTNIRNADGKRMSNQELATEMIASGGLGHSRLSEVSSVLRQGRMGWKAEGPRAWQRTVQAFEDTTRTATYMGARERGMSPEEAAAEVAKIHFDYGQLGHAEKRARAAALPFLTWTSRNVPRQLQLMGERPGKFAAYVKAQNEAYKAQGFSERQKRGSREGVQQYELRQFGIPIVYKDRLYTVSTALPFVDLSRVAPRDPRDLSSWASSPVVGIGQTGLELMGPYKVFVEWATNHSFFYKAPIKGEFQTPSVPAPWMIQKLADADVLPSEVKRRLGIRRIVNQQDPKGGKVWGMDRTKAYVMNASMPGAYGAGSRVTTAGLSEAQTPRGFSWKTELLGSLTGIRATFNDPVKREQAIVGKSLQGIKKADDAAAEEGRTQDLVDAGKAKWTKQDLKRRAAGKRLRARQQELAKLARPGSNPARSEAAKPKPNSAPYNGW